MAYSRQGEGGLDAHPETPQERRLSPGGPVLAGLSSTLSRRKKPELPTQHPGIPAPGSILGFHHYCPLHPPHLGFLTRSRICKLHFPGFPSCSLKQAAKGSRDIVPALGCRVRCPVRTLRCPHTPERDRHGGSAKGSGGGQTNSDNMGGPQQRRALHCLFRGSFEGVCVDIAASPDDPSRVTNHPLFLLVNKGAMWAGELTPCSPAAHTLLLQAAGAGGGRCPTDRTPGGGNTKGRLGCF